MSDLPDSEPPVGSTVVVNRQAWTRTADGWRPVMRSCIDWEWLKRLAAWEWSTDD